MHEPLHTPEEPDRHWGEQLRQWEGELGAPADHQPLPGLWDRIEADLPPTRRRRIAGWWWWAGGSGVVLLLVWLAMYRTPDTATPQMPALDTPISPVSPAPAAAQAPRNRLDSPSPNPPAPQTNAQRAAPDAIRTPQARVHTLPRPQALTPAAAPPPQPASPLEKTSLATQNPAPGTGPTLPPPNTRTDQPAPTDPLPTTTSLAAATDGPARAVPSLPTLALRPVHTEHGRASGQLAHLVRVPASATPDQLAATAPTPAVRWLASAYVAPAATNFQWRDLPSPGAVGRTFNRSRSDIGQEYGLNLGFQVKPRWWVQVGLAGYQGSFERQELFRRLYDPANEQPGPNGDLLSTYALTVSNPDGKSDVEVELSRGAGEVVRPGSFVIIRARTEQSLHATLAPLSVGYQLPLGARWSLGLWGGVVYHRQQLRTLNLTVESTLPGLRTARTRVLSAPEENITTSWDWSAAAGLNHHLTDRWLLYAQPFVQRSLTAPSPGLDTQLTRWGCRIGLGYRW